MSLELEDPGFHYSVLSEFRARFVEAGVEQRLFDLMLQRFVEKGWLKGRGRQRTDSTHILGAIRTLNRLELVGETLRAALNELAILAPEWLKQQVSSDWYERYGQPIIDFRLPKEAAARQALAEQIGRDGRHLLQQLYKLEAASPLPSLACVETLRHVWLQQFY